MRTPPPLDLDVLHVALRNGWGLAVRSLEYAPLGFGSYHWIASGEGGTRRFITVDDLTMKRLPGGRGDAYTALGRAFRSALALYRGGLDFVVAPLPGQTGAVVQRLGRRFSVAVFPFVEGRVSPGGEFESDADRITVTERVRELHRATALVGGIPGSEDFALPWRDELEGSLRQLGTPWIEGPYGEPARRLLQDRAAQVRDALAVYDRLISQVRTQDPAFVITHGEPHAGNVIFTEDGPRLIDWDSALLAPPARDLWMLSAPHAEESETLLLYRLWWELAEIGGYVAAFCRPHAGNEDAAEAWQNLRGFIRLGTLEAARGALPSKPGSAGL